MHSKHDPKLVLSLSLLRFLYEHLLAHLPYPPDLWGLGWDYDTFQGTMFFHCPLKPELDSSFVLHIQIKGGPNDQRGSVSTVLSVCSRWHSVRTLSARASLTSGHQDTNTSSPNLRNSLSYHWLFVIKVLNIFYAT